MPQAPYRAAVAQAVLEADSELGKVRLQVGPKEVQLDVGEERWVLGKDHLSVVVPGRRKPKTRSFPLKASRLFVARAWPTNEVALWLSRKPGRVERLLGLPPRIGMSEEVFASWQGLDRLARKLQSALADYGAEAEAFELGRGGHRVFGVCEGEGLVLHARPIFRERPRRVIELRKDRTLLLPRRRGDKKIDMQRGVEVIASGDRVHFCHPDGEVAGHVFLPWIEAADRVELGKRFQALVGQPLSPREPAPSRLPTPVPS